MIDYTTYIRNRITELRIKKDVSEHQMSLDLGQNRNYIQGISSGKSMPSMAQFLNICEYFGITPMQFFDGETLYPQKPIFRQVHAFSNLVPFEFPLEQQSGPVHLICEQFLLFPQLYSFLIDCLLLYK